MTAARVLVVALVLSLAPPGRAQAARPTVSGQLTIAPVLTVEAGPTYGLPPRVLDFTSNSRLTVGLGAATVNVLLVKPTTFAQIGRPDQFYTVEALAAGQTLRVGDLAPRFTDQTTGYGRIHGAEAILAAGSAADAPVRLHVVHGVSQRAAPTAGYLVGTYRRTFSGARLVLAPVRAVALGASAVRMSDDPQSAQIEAAFARPTPGDNLLAGADLTVSFLRQRRASLAVEYAASVFTDDVTAPDSLGRIRGERLSPRAWAETGVVRRWARVNDSTRVGHVVAARLTLPVGPSRTVVEARQASPLFATLSAPWTPSGARLRVQHTTPLFGRAVQVMAHAEAAQLGPTRFQAYGSRTQTGLASVALQRTPLGRVTLALRGTRRASLAPAPDSGRIDRRSDATMLMPSVAVARDVRLGVPLALTTTLSATTFGDRYRSAYGYRTLGVQVQAQTPTAERVQVQAQARLARTTRVATGAPRLSSEVLVREGYGVRPGRLHVFLVTGVALERAPEWQMASTQWTYGGGARWTPTDATGVEVEWQSRDAFATGYPAYDQRHLELRLTHRW